MRGERSFFRRIDANGMLCGLRRLVQMALNLKFVVVSEKLRDFPFMARVCDEFFWFFGTNSTQRHAESLSSSRLINEMNVIASTCSDFTTNNSISL